MSKSPVRRQLAENLRLIRLLRGWSQEYLAEVTGLDRSYVSSVERAEHSVSLDTLQKMSEALGITLAELTTAPDRQVVCDQIFEAIRNAVDAGRPWRIREEGGSYEVAHA